MPSMRTRRGLLFGGIAALAGGLTGAALTFGSWASLAFIALAWAGLAATFAAGETR